MWIFDFPARIRARIETIFQEKASAEIRGEFFRPNSRVNFAMDFLVDFFGPFSLEEKQEEKIHQKIHGNFQIRIWEFRGQNSHCKDPALTFLGRTPKGAYSSRGRSRNLLETAFSEPLLRTPSENPFPL